MRLPTLLLCSFVLLGGCFRGRGSKGTVPVQPDLPPLPDFVEVCVSKAVVLPAKVNGKSWDGIGRVNRKARKLLPDLIAASQGGGYAAAITAAGSVGTAVFNKVKGPPDLRVQMQLGREYILRTDYVKDTAIAPFGSSEANCAVIARDEYGERDGLYSCKYVPYGHVVVRSLHEICSIRSPWARSRDLTTDLLFRLLRAIPENTAESPMHLNATHVASAIRRR